MTQVVIGIEKILVHAMHLKQLLIIHIVGDGKLMKHLCNGHLSLVVPGFFLVTDHS